MVDKRGVKLTRDAARKVAKVVGIVENEIGDAPDGGDRTNFEVRLRWAELSTDLDPATSGRTTPTTATGLLLNRNRNSDELEDGREITIVNRQADVSGSAGDVIIVANVQGEWTTFKPESSADNLPDGTGGCSCEHCIAGVTLPDSGTLTTGEHCCTDHLRRTVVSPWSEAPGEHDLLYITGNVWLTDPFDGPDCEVEAADEAECDTFNGTWVDPVCTTHNEYRWQVTIDLTGTSYFELVLETDNGCDVPCIKYATSAIRCQCDWTFTLEHNDADFGDVDESTLSCNACVKPTIGSISMVEAGCPRCENGAASLVYAVEISGVTNGTCSDCTDDWNGTWTLLQAQSLSISCFNNLCGWGGFSGGKNPAATGGLNDCYVGSSRSHLCFTIGTPSSNGVPTLIASKNSIFTPTASNIAVWKADPGEFPVGSNCLAPMTLYLFENPSAPYQDGSCNDWPATVTVYPVSVDGSPVTTSSPDTSGKCGTPCAAGNTPADPSVGGCCVDGFWYDYFDETECTAAGGVWDADEVAGAAACAERGACCMTFNATASKVCFESISETLCDTLAGLSEFNEDSYVWTEGETCAAACLPIGACCDSAGTCALTEEAACTGVWHEGATCAAVDNCASELGACCCVDGECANNVPFSDCDPGTCTGDCSFHSGCVDWHIGQDCVDVTCDPVILGACCAPNAPGDCSTGAECVFQGEMTEAACQALAQNLTGCGTNPTYFWIEGADNADCGCDGGGSNCCEGVAI